MTKKKLTYKQLLAERDAYKAENDALKRDRVNRQAKNSVFLNLFSRKEYQLALYKVLFFAGHLHHGGRSGDGHVGHRADYPSLQ